MKKLKEINDLKKLFTKIEEAGHIVDIDTIDVAAKLVVQSRIEEKERIKKSQEKYEEKIKARAQKLAIESYRESREKVQSYNGFSEPIVRVKSKKIRSKIRNERAAVAFTDGSSYMSGASGASVVFMAKTGTRPSRRKKDEVAFVSISHSEQANSRMAEFNAILDALRLAIANGVKDLTVYTDAKGLVSGMSPSSRRKRKENLWLKGNGKPIEDQALWVEFDRLASNLDKFQIIWVKGHSGIEMNELADDLAKEASKKGQNELLGGIKYV